MLYNPFTTRGFAKGLANAQLKSLRAAQKRFPHVTKEELYTAALSTRPGYYRQQIVDIVTTAKETVVQSAAAFDPALGFTFQRVVLVLARREYIERIGHLPSPDVMRDITAGVFSVIPNDL